MWKQLMRTNCPQKMRRFSLTCENHNNSRNDRELIRERIEEDKKKLKWRTPMSEKPEEWYSKMKLFAPEKDTNSHLITKFQQPIDLSPKAIKKWWVNSQEKTEQLMQQFIPERHEQLGNDLAAAHFLVHRGGSIRFKNTKIWITKDEDDNYSLPGHYDPTYLIEAIKCDNMKLYYEGLENVRRLSHLKTLSFRYIKTFDDWCLDRVCGSEFLSLEELDLTGTRVTERGLVALSRIPSLRKLIIDIPEGKLHWDLTCAMLEEYNPKVIISSDNKK